MWIVDDICGRFLIVFTYLFLVGIPLVTVFFGFLPLASLGFTTLPYMIFYIVLVILGIWSHFACWLTNPGALDFAKSK